MNKHHLIAIVVLLALFSCDEKEKAPEVNKKPNILLIMADDMGYSDIGCYGSEIPTPTLDKLAGNGLRFTQFYNAARCCPTRASLLTGISPHKAGMGGMVKHQLAETPNPFQGYLSDNAVTIAELLRDNGYKTYMTGKWHVGEFRPYWPIDRGFDHYYGLISGAMNYWNIEKGKSTSINRKFVEDSTLINDQVNSENDFYSTTAYTNKALNYLENHLSHENQEPFFLYMAHQAPHWPLHAPDSMIAKYRGKYKGGWEQLRKERYTRMQDMGIVNDAMPLTPLDSNTYNWEKLTEAQKDSMDLKMAIYAGMIDLMDQNIGRLISFLEEKGELKNTLVIFLSDNGASHESGSLGQNFRPDLTGKLGGEDSYHSYGLSWANASNTPFQKFKSYTFEGGVATPMIVSWGDYVANKGGLNGSLGHITDIMATILEVAEAQYPSEYKGNAIPPMEGKSLLPVLTGQTGEIRTENDALIWEHIGNRAVRKGKWKIVANKGEKKWRLYNMEIDRVEMNDVSSQHPEIVKSLAQEYTNSL